jgi:hypothetical protein
MRAILPLLLLAGPAAAQVCGNFDLSGAYGFQLSGNSTISGAPKPIGAIGRLVFETGGRVSGVSSVNFGGLFLGNPVTGTYTQAADCTLTVDLQDDSGGWQHFRGKLTPGGARARFQQTDAGAGARGALAKLPASCGADVVNGRYAVNIDGRRTVTSADGRGNLSWNAGDAVNTGTYTVDGDCFAEIQFGMKLRGIVVDGGKTVFAVQTDPLKVATATFTAE